MEFEVERISPEKAIEILKKDGLEVTLEQAKLILEFLYQMADVVVDQYLEKSKLNYVNSLKY